MPLCGYVVLTYLSRLFLTTKLNRITYIKVIQLDFRGKSHLCVCCEFYEKMDTTVMSVQLKPADRLVCLKDWKQGGSASLAEDDNIYLSAPLQRQLTY